MVEGVRVLDRADYNLALDLSVRVERTPGALLFKNAVTDGVEARVCGGCGLVELYAKNPAALVRASNVRSRRRPQRELPPPGKKAGRR